uniref:Inner membrane protein n=1 Tax=Heterorhabditis bacteriophora TaxID=37862 RepID=A0A1I7WGN4_HETBA
MNYMSLSVNHYLGRFQIDDADFVLGTFIITFRLMRSLTDK